MNFLCFLLTSLPFSITGRVCWHKRQQEKGDPRWWEREEKAVCGKQCFAHSETISLLYPYMYYAALLVQVRSPCTIFQQGLDLLRR